MNPRAIRILKIAAAAAALAFVVFALYLGVPHLTGSNHRLPGNASNSPMALMEWTLRGVGNDEPQKVWNAFTDDYRKSFSDFFKQVLAGAVDAGPWLKAADKAGLASTGDEMNALSDTKMFRVWWELTDRTIVGFHVPLFLSRPSGDSESAQVLKVFYETNPPVESKGSFVLYQIGNESDLVTMSRVDGGWRIDVAREIPAGL